MSWVAFSLLVWLLASIPISLVAGAAIAAGHDPAVDPAEERALAPVVLLARAAARSTPA